MVCHRVWRQRWALVAEVLEDTVLVRQQPLVQPRVRWQLLNKTALNMDIKVKLKMLRSQIFIFKLAARLLVLANLPARQLEAECRQKIMLNLKNFESERKPLQKRSDSSEQK